MRSKAPGAAGEALNSSLLENLEVSPSHLLRTEEKDTACTLCPAAEGLPGQRLRPTAEVQCPGRSETDVCKEMKTNTWSLHHKMLQQGRGKKDEGERPEVQHAPSCVCEKHKQTQKNWQGKKKKTPVIPSDLWAPIINATTPLHPRELSRNKNAGGDGCVGTLVPQRAAPGRRTPTPQRRRGAADRHLPRQTPPRRRAPHSPRPVPSPLLVRFFGPRVFFLASLRGKRDLQPNLQNSN